MYDLGKYKECNYIDEIYEYSSDSFKYNEKHVVGYWFSILVLLIIVLVNLPFKVDVPSCLKRIGISRNKLHKKILSESFEGLLIIEDDIKNKEYAIYRLGRRRDRLKYILKSFFHDCRTERKKLHAIISDIHCNNKGKRRQLIQFFNQRIAHTCYFAWAISDLLHKVRVEAVCVSFTHDRFALLTEQICKNMGIELICIPHGEIENISLPRRYPGDKVYVLNAYVAKAFNKAYNTNAYLYDYDLLKNIYRKKYDGKGGEVVYLITPFFFVEEQIAYIDIIADHLQSTHRKLYVKQHPTSRCDVGDSPNIEEVNTLEEAICGNFCIGFFSTALIEAVFNDSEAVSLLKMIDEKKLYIKHKMVFEGCGVTCVGCKEELFTLIDNYIEGMN